MAPLDEHDMADARRIEEAAQDLRVSITTVKRLMRLGELDTIRVGVGGGRVLIPRRSIVAYINRHHVRGDGS